MKASIISSYLLKHGEMENSDESMNRAELFDSIAHPIRIKILKMLQRKSMSFSELKEALGIESSGHLQHHMRRLGDVIKQDAYGKYTISDDGKEIVRFLEIAEQMVMAKPRFKISYSWKKALGLMLGIFVLSLIIFEIWQYSSKQIPLYEKLDLSEDFIIVSGKRFRYLLITTSELENCTRIAFRGVSFTYLAPTTFRIPVRVILGKTDSSDSISEIEVTSTGFKVEHDDGRTEIIPIMPWIGGDTIPAIISIRDYGNVMIYYSPFYIGEPKALVFQIGSKTMMLLVRAEP